MAFAFSDKKQPMDFDALKFLKVCFTDCMQNAGTQKQREVLPPKKSCEIPLLMAVA